jgi:hypothetical protein
MLEYAVGTEVDEHLGRACCECSPVFANGRAGLGVIGIGTWFTPTRGYGCPICRPTSRRSYPGALSVKLEPTPVREALCRGLPLAATSSVAFQ